MLRFIKTVYRRYRYWELLVRRLVIIEDRLGKWEAWEFDHSTYEYTFKGNPPGKEVSDE